MEQTDLQKVIRCLFEGVLYLLQVIRNFMRKKKLLGRVFPFRPSEDFVSRTIFLFYDKRVALVAPFFSFLMISIFQ